MSENSFPSQENIPNNNELYSEIDESQSLCERHLGLSCKRFFLYASLVLGAGVYIGTLLFGTSSLEVLLGLDEYENYLEIEVERFKQDNAELQKEYFELKELDSDAKN